MTTRDSAPAATGVNWEAYSHEELHQMLWEDADVADVSTVATEWTQHRAALDTHADVLREQRAALLDGWQGPAAEEAANRLDALATRVEKISELARAGQQAAQDAADALAMARAMMPPPPTDPAALFTGAQASPMPGAPPLPAMPPNPFASYSAIPSFAPAPPSPGMNNAFGAVGSGGFSFYFGAGAMDQQKAQAVRAMQTYESSLAGSGRMIDEARGAIPPASTTTRTSAIPASPSGGGGSSGVPWARLVGGGSGSGGVSAFRGGMGMGVSPVIGSPPGAGPSAPPLGAGPRVGALAGLPGGPGTPAGQLATQSAAARGAGPGGLMSPFGAQRGADDEPYENRLPRIDHGLFTVDTPTTPAVIGEATTIGAQQ